MMCCSREGGVGNIWCRSAEPVEERNKGTSEYDLDCNVFEWERVQ